VVEGAADEGVGVVDGATVNCAFVTGAATFGAGDEQADTKIINDSKPSHEVFKLTTVLLILTVSPTAYLVITSPH